MSSQNPPPIAITQKEAIRLLRSDKIFRRALHADWITPVVQGGKGRASLFDYQDLLKLWERLKQGEFPPKLPCERRGIMKLLGGVWEFLTKPAYTLPPREEIEKAMAAAYQEAAKEREAEALAAEQSKLDQKRTELREEEVRRVEVDPNIFG